MKKSSLMTEEKWNISSKVYGIQWWSAICKVIKAKDLLTIFLILNMALSLTERIRSWVEILAQPVHVK